MVTATPKLDAMRARRAVHDEERSRRLEREAADRAAASAIIADASAELPAAYHATLRDRYESAAWAGLMEPAARRWTNSLGLERPTAEKIARAVVAAVRAELAAGTLARIVSEGGAS